MIDPFYSWFIGKSLLKDLGKLVLYFMSVFPLTKLKMRRICIYSKDISWITGRSERYSRDVLRDIRLLRKKEKHQLITIAEACDYLGLPYDEVCRILNGG